MYWSYIKITAGRFVFGEELLGKCLLHFSTVLHVSQYNNKIYTRSCQEAAKNISSPLQRSRITFQALLSPSFLAPPVPAAHGQGASSQSAALLLLQGQLYLQRSLWGLEKELVEQEIGMGWLLKQKGRKTSLYRHRSQDDTLERNRKQFQILCKIFSSLCGFINDSEEEHISRFQGFIFLKGSLFLQDM